MYFKAKYKLEKLKENMPFANTKYILKCFQQNKTVATMEGNNYVGAYPSTSLLDFEAGVRESPIVRKIPKYIGYSGVFFFYWTIFFLLDILEG